MGSRLIPKELLAARDWEGLSRTVAEVLAILKALRAGRG